MKKLITICLMLLGAVAQAQNFAITATTEAAVRKNIVKGNAANFGFGVINDTLKLIGLTTRNVIFTGSISKSGIGLGNVDNTSDANKPVSTFTQTQLNLKQNQLNGTGFVKATGTTISYDNSTYLSTSTAASTYLPIANPNATGTLTAPTITNSLGANFATTSGYVGVGTIAPASKLDVNGAIRATAFEGISTTPLVFSLNGNQDIHSKAASGKIRFIDFGYANENFTIDQLGNTYVRGNFGVGTTSTYKGHIYGAGEAISGGITNAGAKGASLYIQDSGAGAYNGGSVIFGANQGVGSAIKYELTDGTANSQGDLSFQVRPNTSNTFLTTALQIKSTGNVGIGTIFPNAKLDVAGNIFASGNNPIVSGTTGVGIGTSAGYPQISLRDNAGATDAKTWDTYAAGTIMYSRVINDSNNSAQVWQQVQRSGATVSSVSFPSGNVGIGTSSPAHKLDIVGNVNTNGGIYFNSRLFANASGNYLILHDMNAASGIAHANIYMGQGDETNYYDNSGHIFRNRAGSLNRLQIFHNGNVGINTTTDEGYKLDVNGSARVTGNSTFSASVGIGTISPQNLLHVKGAASVGIGVRSSHLIIESTETAGVDVGAVLKFGGQSGNAVNPYSFGTIEARKESAAANNYSSYLSFHTIDNTGGSSERIRINANGNVGIGTTAPSSKLQVVGLPVYENNAAAVAGGLTTGAFYRTSAGVVMCVL